MTNEVSPNTNNTHLCINLNKIHKNFLKLPIGKLVFITIKDNSQRSVWCKIDKVRKWLSKFSDHYFIVRGRVNGFHFHVLALKKHTNIRLFKGIHMRFDPVSVVKRESSYDFNEPYHESHPCSVDYRWGVNIMEVNQEIRMKFGGLKSSLPSRIKAKAYRQLRKLRINDDVGRILNYLVKNINESCYPTVYEDYYITTNLVN